MVEKDESVQIDLYFKVPNDEKLYLYEETYIYQSDFNAVWQWTEGNFGCDCNRGLFLENKYPDLDTGVTDCGNTIQLVRVVEHGTTRILWPEDEKFYSDSGVAFDKIISGDY